MLNIINLTIFSTSRIGFILKRIKLPNNVVIELQKELKSSKYLEKKYYTQEIKRLRGEQDKLKQKMDKLFDLRLDGELYRETFDAKRNDIQVQMNRLKKTMFQHMKKQIKVLMKQFWNC